MARKNKTYSADAYLITNDEGQFMHRVRHGHYLWRKDISPYTVCQFKHMESAARAISRIGLCGSPIKAQLSFRPIPID
jgi:hypothetical protein